MAAARRIYTEEVLRDAVRQATSVAGVLRHLGFNEAGGTHAHLSRTIKAMGIDTGHFVRNQGSGAHRRRSAEDLLVRILPGSRRTKPPLLKRALLETGARLPL